MRCFEKCDTYNAINYWNKEVRERILKLSAREVDRTDREAWVDHFISEFEVIPVELYPDAREYALVEKVVKERNQWFRHFPDEKEYYDRPGVKITCRVPYTGSHVTFDLSATLHISFNYDAERVIEPDENGIGYLVLSCETTQKNATPENINGHFNYAIKEFADEIGRINDNLKPYNEGLRAIVEATLDERMGQLDKLASLRVGLNIPLSKVDGAPMTVPIPLKKKRLHFSKPKPESREPSYCIKDEDYQHITEVIDGCCSTMEAAPISYAAFGEEQLRDHILSLLNTHYENATGETFRKHGKADIHIPFEDHTAYIAECKIWHGQKTFLKAIDQLFSYTTWRDTKVSLVVFNRNVKSYDKLLDSIQNALDGIAISIIRVEHAVWKCKVQNEEDERVMNMTVQVFDLHYEEKAS